MCISQCAYAHAHASPVCAPLFAKMYVVFTLFADTLDNRRYLESATNDHHYYYSVKIESETQRGLC